MGRLIMRKDLTKEQYKRANFTMLTILITLYLSFIVVEVININKEGMNSSVIIGLSVYGVSILGSIVSYNIFKTLRKCMIIFSIFFLISYATLVFGNGVVVMAMVLPGLAGFMIYLNSVVVGLGAIGTIIICGIKCYMVIGDKTLFNYAILIYLAIIICIYAAFRAIFLLIKFGKEDQEEIKKAAEHREEVARVVAMIVEKLDNDFKDIVVALDNINGAMSSADIAMDDIASSSENTASAVSNQADMTSHIQERIESTNDLTVSAKDTTKGLKEIIVEGKNLSDKLEEQSNVVDQNISRISETVENLVMNVQEVSGITESILNISTQTNLLALNASIEAARAGEAGRGFAVVAEEIRKLAEETKDSTEKITTIINQLTSVTNETQAGIEESVECINEQRTTVSKVNDSLTEVENGMFELESDVVKMSSEVESVLEANKKIVDSISLLSITTEEVSAVTENCKDNTSSIFENLEEFSAKVNEAFEQLQKLEKTVTEE